jgi:hypothetical protein
MKKLNLLLSFIALLLLTGNPFAHAQRITVTVAGSGSVGFGGDGLNGRVGKSQWPI